MKINKKKIDIETGKWNKIEIRKGSIAPRSRHNSLKIDSKTMLISPGLFGRNKLSNSFDFFHTDDNSCEKVDSKSLFCSYRAGHCSVYDPNTKKIFMFGGFNQSSQLINDPCLISMN